MTHPSTNTVFRREPSLIPPFRLFKPEWTLPYSIESYLYFGMPLIELHTEIKAQRQLVFDLSRSVDLHIISTKRSHEKAVDGKTSGLLGLNESVTWRAKHLGFYQTLSSKITAFDRPNYFVDEMVKGAFKSFKHEHQFRKEKEDLTIMIDRFDYQSPLGVLGRLADRLFLKKYMSQLLIERNKVIKNYAESEQWKEIIHE